MKESAIVTKILKHLNATPFCKGIKLPGGPYLEVGTPDIVFSYHGWCGFIEVKTPTGTVSKIQEHRLKQWSDTGAVARVARCVEDVDEAMNKCIYEALTSQKDVV